MIEIICSRSGLKFKAENRRKKVHPEISWYTQHSNYDIRYPAINVIERGKAEGWDTIEKFEEEIQKAFNPEPPVRPDYDFEGDWVAKVIGSSEKYRFDRAFLTPVDTVGRFSRFSLKTDGIYECCYKSGKGNETRYYYQVENETLTPINLEAVEALFPSVEEQQAQLEIKFADAVKARTTSSLGGEGNIITHEGQRYKIAHVEATDRWEDDDGITHECSPGRDCMHSWTSYLYYLIPATAEEMATQDVQKSARKRLVAIYESISVNNGATSPKSADYPKGKEIVMRQGRYQPNNLIVMTDAEAWGLTYNGRDGDDWSCNNVSGSWVGCWIPLTDELKLELQVICDLLGL